MDHLVLYRPGSGVIFILQNNGGVFQPVLQSFNGIGGYDLLSPDDHVFALDYNSSGKTDHLALYRAGQGVFFILQNVNGVFIPVLQTYNGIGGYNLMSADDLVFAYDFDRSGYNDHLVLYRHGTGTVWILRKNSNGDYNAVYHQGDPGNGIGQYDLKDNRDMLFAFDYDRSGRADHLCCYRPGEGTFWIIKRK